MNHFYSDANLASFPAFAGAHASAVAAPTDRVLVGTPFADVLRGEGGNDRLYGMRLDDKLFGGGGNDKIYGGLGNDLLSGGGGGDLFCFGSKLDAKTNVDRITDFSPSADSFLLDQATFKKLGWSTANDPRAMTKGFFTAGGHARDRDDYIVYDQKTGTVSYDKDGSGAGAAVPFAVVKPGVHVTAADFLVL